MSGWDWALALATAVTLVNIVVTIVNVRIYRNYRRVK